MSRRAVPPPQLPSEREFEWETVRRIRPKLSRTASKKRGCSDDGLD